MRPSLDLYLYLHFFRLHCTVPTVLPRRRCAHLTALSSWLPVASQPTTPNPIGPSRVVVVTTTMKMMMPLLLMKLEVWTQIGEAVHCCRPRAPPRTVCCTAPPARARAVSLHAPGPKHRDHTTGGETIGAAMPLPSLSMMSLLEPRRWPLHLAHEPDARMLTAFTQGEGKGRGRGRGRREGGRSHHLILT